MTTALFAVPGILAPLQSLFRWFAAGALPSRCAAQTASLRHSDIGEKSKVTKTTATKAIATKIIADYAIPTRARGINGTQTRAGTLYPALPAGPAAPGSHALPPARRSSLSRGSPVLRVMRLLETGQAPASVGRMVISGRMADVCAELDRLAAREVALH